MVMDTRTPDKFVPVVAAAEMVGRSLGVNVRLAALPDFRDGAFSHFGRSRVKLPFAIEVGYDPELTSPSELWWIFCHELGHIRQAVNGETAKANQVLRSTGSYLEAVKPLEIDAWDKAYQFASMSSWKPDERFFRLRDVSLATYDVHAP